MIELRNVYFEVKDAKLENINLKVEDGEYLVIMGPSGAGKTFLLLIVAGIIKPQSGTVLIDGKDVTDELPESRNIALVPQNYMLFPHLSVYENIAYGLRARRIEKLL